MASSLGLGVNNDLKWECKTSKLDVLYLIHLYLHTHTIKQRNIMKSMWYSNVFALTDLPFFEDYPFSESFLYIRSFATGQPINLVGNCLFPRMSKKYDYYILFNRITSNCCTLILGVYYNKIPPEYFLTMEPSLKPHPAIGRKNRWSRVPKQSR